jgi:hypothetical protein
MVGHWSESDRDSTLKKRTGPGCGYSTKLVYLKVFSLYLTQDSWSEFFSFLMYCVGQLSLPTVWSTFHHCNKYLSQSIYKKEKLILADSFSSQVLWPCCFESVAAQYIIAEVHSGEACLPHSR